MFDESGIMRQKLITLCLNSFEMATKMDNFSAWVRGKLLEEGQNNAMGELDNTRYRYKCACCSGEMLPYERKPLRCPNPGCSLMPGHMKYMGVIE